MAQQIRVVPHDPDWAVQYEQERVQPADALGYEYMGEFGILGRRYLRKGGDNRTHQVHIFESSNTTDILRHLAFRDYLRAHHAVCAAYSSDWRGGIRTISKATATEKTPL